MYSTKSIIVGQGIFPGLDVNKCCRFCHRIRIINPTQIPPVFIKSFISYDIMIDSKIRIKCKRINYLPIYKSISENTVSCSCPVKLFSKPDRVIAISENMPIERINVQIFIIIIVYRKDWGSEKCITNNTSPVSHISIS